MKRVARLEGFANAHPYMPAELIQGALEVQKTLETCLAEISGMDAVTLQPAAGAHGELTGILMIRAYHESKGNPRRRVLVPDSAHGTNPASVAISGYVVDKSLRTRSGTVDLEALRKAIDDDVAAVMITNPNTLGIFESEIAAICRSRTLAWRAGLHGRRESERDDGHHAAGRFRHRCPPHQPAQDIHDAAWRRRTGRRPRRCEEDPRAVSSLPGPHAGTRRHSATTIPTGPNPSAR